MEKTHILTLFAPGTMAGAEKMVSVGFNALRHLDKQNEEALVIIGEKACPQYAQDFAQTIIDKSSYQIKQCRMAIDPKLILQLKFLTKELNIKIIHTHGYKALFYAHFVKLINPFAFKIIHTHHGNTGHTKKVIFYEQIAYILMRYCAQVISLSPVMSKELNKNKVFKIKEISNTYSLPHDTCEISEPKNDTKVFLYLGRLSPEKNPLTLLKAFRKIEKENPQLELHIVGDGPLLNPCRNEYKSHQIHFHGHVCQVRNLIEKADYLCLPSLKEGMPITIIEALCLGRPIIANKVGAIEYMLTPKNSYLIDIEYLKKDPKQMIKIWALTLKKALKEKNPENNKKIYAWKNRHREREKYSIEKWVNQTLKLYGNLKDS